MKIFLSWSGELSHKIAITLRDWLPQVIQSLEPYVSSEDIDKGTRWSTDIAKELEESAYGIIVITKDNLLAPWINFEAGALSKLIDKSNVSPFLFNVKRSEVKGPLLQFQSTIFEKDDILKLVKSINNRTDDDDRLDDAKLEKAFKVWWGELESNLNQILSTIPTEKSDHKEDSPTIKRAEILEELLHLVRDQHKIMSNPDKILPPEYLDFVFNRSAGPRSKLVIEKQYHMLHRDIMRLGDLIPKIDGSPQRKEQLEYLWKKIHRRFSEISDLPFRPPRTIEIDIFEERKD